jgi:phosphate transport system permease protein
LRAVPISLREGAMALGANQWMTIATVVIPAAIRGILSGMMLNLARVAGETAPLLLTAGLSMYWNHGWTQPVATLPVMIYTDAVGPQEDLHRQAWAAGFVLLSLVLLVNVIARTIISRGVHKPR